MMRKPMRPYAHSVPKLAEEAYKVLCDFYGIEYPGGVFVTINPDGDSFANPESGAVVISLEEVSAAAEKNGIPMEVELEATTLHEVGHIITHDLRREDPETFKEILEIVVIERTSDLKDRLKRPSEATADFFAGVAIGLNLAENPPKNPERYLRDLMLSQKGAGCLSELGCLHQSPAGRCWNFRAGISEAQNAEISDDEEDDDEHQEPEEQNFLGGDAA